MQNITLQKCKATKTNIFAIDTKNIPSQYRMEIQGLPLCQHLHTNLYMQKINYEFLKVYKNECLCLWRLDYNSYCEGSVVIFTLISLFVIIPDIIDTIQ